MEKNSPTGRVLFFSLDHNFKTSGMYYKQITIINDNSRVVRMMLQVESSPMIVILMILEVSFMLLENIYSTGVTRDNQPSHDDCYIFIVQATGLVKVFNTLLTNIKILKIVQEIL